ncbi:MAG TPA: CHAT domain-containing tetratricopeptide repeat protein [Blastocatellia bacterium]|nr:CHAT domain-containing tetratricopeptide repeat protein [Blastocatellia bacterium]
MASSGVGIKYYFLVCVWFFLPLVGFSQAIKPIQNSIDLFEAIVSLPTGDEQKAIKLLDEYKSLIGEVFCGSLMREAEKANNAKDPSRSFFLLQVLVAASERSGNSLIQANAFHKIGKLYYETRQPQKAIEAYRNCIRVCLESVLKPADNRSDLKRLLATALYGLGRVQFETSDFQNAIESYDRSFKAFEEINSKLDCIRILNDLGTLYISIGDYKTAKEVSMRSLSLTAALFEGKESSNFFRYSKAIAWSNLGYISTWEGDYPRALDLLLKSLALFEEMVAAGLPYRTAVADRLEDLGQVYYFLGNYAKALNYYHRALTTIEAINPTDTRQRILTDLGILYLDQGDYPRANDFLEQSLKLALQLDNKIAVATALSNIGLSNQRQGKYEKAFDSFQAALKIAEAIAATRLIIPSLEGLGTVAQAQSNYDSALAYFDKALAASDKIGDKNREAELLWRKAEVYVLKKSYREALELSDRAVVLARELSQPNISYLALLSKAKASLAQYQSDSAIQALSDAISEAELIRSNVAGREQQSTLFFQNRVEPYYLMIDLLAKQNRVADAMLYAERAKGRVLLDVLQGNKLNVTKEMSAGDREHEQQLRTEIQLLNVRIYTETQARGSNQSLIADLNARLRKARLEYESFENNLYATDRDRQAHRAEARSLAIEDLGALLPDSKTALLEFAVLEDKTYLFVITRDNTQGNGANGINIKLYPIALKKADLMLMVQTFRERIATRSIGTQRLALELYKLLLQPAKDQLAGRNMLVLAPDEILWELPFQALQSVPGRYLIEDFSTYYAPSLTVLCEIVKKRASKASLAPSVDSLPPRSGSFLRPTLLAFGNPALSTEEKSVAAAFRDNTLSSLPEAEREVKALAEIYGRENSKVFIGSSAQEETAKSAMGNYKVLHFATHSILDNQGPMYSRIVLSQVVSNHNEDGMLEAWEIAQLELNADIVVLSACETARGQIRAGEGVTGLSWSFFVAGCPTTVVSQWKVESAGTTEMMIGFHNNLLSTVRSSNNLSGKAEALRAAALKMLKSEKYQDPFYWASFVVVGDGR